jgi:hypothetical protein
MLNRAMVTAYSQEYNLTLEHDIMGRGLIASVGYVGSKGDKLYSLNNLNQRGSCIMISQAWCDNGSVPARTRLNQTGVTGMNRRGNEGWSRYNSLQTELRTREIAHSGLQLAATYTWAHAIDNTSSFFNDSAYASYNGDFGFSDPYNPSSDKASGDNDVRNRFTMNYVWSVPWGKSASGWAGQVLGGWQLAGIYSAQSGVPISIFEDLGSFNDVCSLSIGNSCYPIVTGPLPAQHETASGLPNRTVLYDFSNSLESLAQYCNGDLACTQQAYFFPSHTPFLHRNQFHTPGYWNFDASLLKNFKLPKEGMALQFRAEFFNLFNHSNLYADPTTNSLLSGQLLARRGVPPSKETFGAPPDRRNIQLGLRLSF